MKTIIITGANGNLGTVVTRLFLDKGYNVIAVISPNADRTFISHENLETLSADLSDETAAAELVKSSITKHRRIHAALLLVGGFAAGDISSTSGSDIAGQISLNFNTAYFVARPVYAHMQQYKEGRIVFIGARPALLPSYGKGLVAYGLSKSLLFRLAEFINEESRGTGIAATVIAPGTLDTPQNRKSMPDADPEKWVKAEELADILEFVVSDKSSALRETVLKVYNKS